MNMLVSGTALILACVSFIAYDVFAIRRSMVENISMQAQIAGVNSISALLFNDPDSANKTLASLSPVPDIVSAAIYSADGKPFALFQRGPKSQIPIMAVIPPGQLEFYSFGKGRLVLARVIMFQDRPLGHIYILSNLSRLNTRIGQYLLIAALVLTASLFAAVLISPFFRRAIAEPIVHLAEIARIVTRDKDYSIRAAPTRNRDELAVLIETFNGMLSQIQIRDAAVQQAHDELEHRIAERTAELTEANDQLRQEVINRKRIAEDLEASEEKFRNLTETAGDAILSADSQGNIVYFNRAAERIFSYSADEIRGQTLTVLMPERFRDAHRQGFGRFLRTGEARVIGKTVELAGRRKDGTEFPLQVSLSTWKTRAGVFFTGILSDITERKLAEDALERHRSDLVRSNAELAAANKELESFSYSVSHDLRTPLRSIDGFSQALLEDYADKLDATAQEHLRRVRGAAQRMAALIDDMLNLSRVARCELHRQKLDLSAMAKSIAAELQEAEPGRRVEFVIENGLTAVGDSQLLRAAMENLLRNSWKYTSGHASAKIEFGKIDRNGKSRFFARDDGAGFDPRYADRLFGAFQRLHTEAEFPGTGIGLATVQRIIHRHGGEIWAEGAVEKGATFYFTL